MTIPENKEIGVGCFIVTNHRMTAIQSVFKSLADNNEWPEGYQLKCDNINWLVPVKRDIKAKNVFSNFMCHFSLRQKVKKPKESVETKPIILGKK